jgi:hypothetical protein
MNYGDGIYGGAFVAALYAEAFFQTDILSIIENALISIPSGSDYYKIIRDVIKLHNQYPDDWRISWKELENKWGDVDICGAGSTFNIDAKLNGAYIVLGLLYGKGDPMKTLEITTRCGQDSDCNPSNALAVIGVIKGFRGLPSVMQEGVSAMGDSVFIHTTYTYNSAVESSFNYALGFIEKDGGKIGKKKIRIKTQKPAEPKLEVAFPDVVFDRKISVFEENEWRRKGKWEIREVPVRDEQKRKQSIYSDIPGSEIELTFTGTGIALYGNWFKDGGKADVLIDGNLNRTIDTYYFFANQQHTECIWHVMNLPPQEHIMKLIVRGEKRPESSGSRVYITEARIFRTEKKKNDDYRFSFEQ